VTLDQLLDRLTGRWAVSLKAWALLTIIGTIGTYTRSKTLFDLTQSELLTLIFSLAACNSLIYFLISQTILRRRKVEKQKLVKVIFSYVFIWFASCTLEILFTIFIFENTAYIGPQLFAPLFPDLFGFIASTYLLAEFDSNRQDRSRLAFARDALLETSEKSRKQVLAERSQLITAIQNSVFYQLDALKQQFGKLRESQSHQEIERLADELERYSANTIRSLSHEMAEDTGNSAPVDRLTFIGTKTLPTFTNVKTAIISFNFSIGTLIVVGGFHGLSLNGFAGLGFQLLTALTIAPILFLGSIFTRDVGSRRPTIGFMAFLSTIFACGFATVVASDFLNGEAFDLRNEYPANEFAVRTLATIMVCSLVVTIVEARRQTLKDLIAMNDQLQVELDWIDGRSQEIRKELSTILHGPLQGRIAGIAMALRMNGSQTSSGIELTDQKLAEIEALLASVIVDVQGLFKVADIKQEASIVIKLINLRRSWNGIADVTWKIDPEVFAGMKSEWLEKLSDILYEAVSNSVRHGGADKVFMEFKVNEGKLVLHVTDNGSGIKSDFVPSVGLHKITEFGAEYEFATDRETGAELIIKINLAN